MRDLEFLVAVAVDVAFENAIVRHFHLTYDTKFTPNFA